MTSLPVDEQWLDFYALLDVPVNADEDTIRKRIGKVYSEAAANSDHRDLKRRHYYQALVERVLPQCRRVLLDPEWRAKYDRQHILHSIGDPSSQDYVTFIASMRGKEIAAPGDENLPQRVQEDIKAARQVVECARQGAELDLLPSKAISTKDSSSGTSGVQSQAPVAPAPQPEVKGQAAPAGQVVVGRAVGAQQPVTQQPVVQQVAQPVVEVQQPVVFQQPVVAQPPVAAQQTPESRPTAAQVPAPVVEPIVEEIVQSGEPARLKVITAQEADAIRRRRSSNPDEQSFAPSKRAVADDGSVLMPRKKGRKGPISRVMVGGIDPTASGQRLISPTSMNLMVAIVGVLLTISIQKFATTPAVATNQGRMPIYIAVSSEMEGAMQRAETNWEKTPEGSNYDLVVQPVDSRDGMSRALGASGQMPDVWIPSDSLWAAKYNAAAPQFKREAITPDTSIAQTPMVLIARADRSNLLRQRFPNHQITSWDALRSAVASGAAGHLGLADPQRAATGSLARFSMAREWGSTHNMTASQAAKNPGFWQWMAGFEENAPAASPQTGAMVKDLVLGTTGRFWWAVAYESDALAWMSQGKAIEIFYLPRTSFADHPFCDIERVGAPVEVSMGRASFEKYLRSDAMQKELLASGFRPTEIGLKTKTHDNPFLNMNFRAKGARTDNLARGESPSGNAIDAIVREWGKRYG